MLNTTRPTWKLDPDYTVMRLLCPRLCDYVFSKFVIILMVMICGAAIVLHVLNKSARIQHTYLIFCCWLCLIPWLTCSLLLVNRCLIPKIIANLDTWIKSASTVFLVINGSIWYYNDLKEVVPIPLQITCYITILITLLLLILMISSIDGLYH